MTALPLTEDDCTDGNSVAVIGLGAAEVPAHVQMAEKQLCGFARIAELKPGESRTVTVRIPERSLCYWDPERELSTRPDGTKDK